MLITFEGIDGCGKSTQIHKVAHSLTENGHRVIVTREPYGKWVKNALEGQEISPQDKLAILMDDRASHVQKVIMPHLADSFLVLCDRFIDSTAAYQGYGDGLSIEMINRTNNIVTNGITPDLTIWLDVPVPTGLTRVNRRGSADGIESQGAEYFHRVADGYRKLASQHPHRIYRVDGVGSADDVAARVQSILTDKLPFLYKQKHSLS